jgi:hypothetical protein
MGFLAEQNLKMLGSTLAASFVLTISIFFIMQWLIDVGDVELDSTSIKIAALGSYVDEGRSKMREIV